ncbi:class IV adenylate cyclase [Peptoniphilus sp. oral taxon 386]|uniref:class IV adenylate cyclase n=1 Tax=Peptoniphilus sp. oral taxon 386 TaxID=652713 RepID=UPI0001DA9B2F|nr:class IV adenylate cyclase [Peptoniphilus sp. oral taxon 386]EFI42121.1 adenylate cyclase [Peptoniphilus sp. oral taxon 386 str. F0131]
MIEREIEVKLLGLDIYEVEKELIKRGATLIAREYQENLNIDSSVNPIKNNAKGYLRIRYVKNLLNNEENIYITFKEQITNKGVRENIEHTSEITDKEQMISILKLLGYDIYDIGYKNRVSYMYKNNRFDIDTWDKNTYPYPFIEVESKNEQELYSIIDELGIDKEAISTKSIAELKKSVKIV